MNTQPTIETIRDTAKILKDYAADIERIANLIEKTGDLTRTSDVLAAVTNCFNNLRLDLLIVRPLREYERELQKQ